MESYDAALALVVPEDVEDPDSWMKNNKNGETLGLMQPVDRVLSRLSAANLLRKTMPEPLEPPPTVQHAESAEGSEETPHTREEIQTLRFQAIEMGLRQCEEDSVPRWAKASASGKDPLTVTQGKPFLNLIVSQYRTGSTIKPEGTK